MSNLLLAFFSTAAMFDAILALFPLIGMHGVLCAANGTVPVLAALLIGSVLFVLAQGWVPFPVAGAPEAPASWPIAALFQIALFPPLYPAYDVRPLAQAISAAQSAGRVVANLGTYHDQFHFAGRLHAPLHEVERREAMKAWLAEHPDAYAVVYVDSLARLTGIQRIAAQPYLDGAAALLDAPSAILALDRPKMRDRASAE